MTEEPLWIIYGLREGITGSKYRYVGYTTKGAATRLRIHKNDARKKTTPVGLWISSKDFNILIEVIEICPSGDVDNIFEREIYWIDHFREVQGSLSDKRTPDYLKNWQNGGGSGSLGTTLSDTHKKSIAEGVIKYFEENGHKPVYDFWIEKYGQDEADRLREEYRKKRSEQMSGEGNPMFGKTGQDAPCHGRVGDKHPMFGTHHSDEVRARISATTKGRPKSEVTKIRMSYANHVRFHMEKEKSTCRWCLGADLQIEIQRRETELNGDKVE